MKLDRNIEGNEGRGKYALLLLRRLSKLQDETWGTLPKGVHNAIRCLENAGLIDWGRTGAPSEFFVIRLKDIFADAALSAYAEAAKEMDPEWAQEVEQLARRAGVFHPNRQQPD